MKVIKLSNKIIKEVIEVINKGGVVIFPTDTVYGLICDATNKKAVEKIFRIKKRDKEKTLPIFISSIKEAKEIAMIDKKQEGILKKYWPGKYTFILNSNLKSQISKSQVKIKNQPFEESALRLAKLKLSKLVVREDNTIALRISNYKELNNLLKKIKIPLAQTSANISNFPATTKIEEVVNYFKDAKNKPNLIIDAGNLKKSSPSKIFDIMKGKKKKIR